MSSEESITSSEPSTPHIRPSDVFLRSVASQVNKEDIYKMVDSQLHMLQRFEKTNEMLVNFNVLSSSRYQTTCQEFKKHTQLLTEMKKDLDNVFRRIRNMKTKLSRQHPEAFAACSNVYFMTDDEHGDQHRLKPTRSKTILDNDMDFSDIPARERAPTL